MSVGLISTLYDLGYCAPTSRDATRLGDRARTQMDSVLRGVGDAGLLENADRSSRLGQGMRCPLRPDNDRVVLTISYNHNTMLLILAFECELA